MAHRPAGYDKYYMAVACAQCGGYTGKEYAWRFGEHEPVVYCSGCKVWGKRQAAQARKHPQNHKHKVMCDQCGAHLRTVVDSVGHNRDLYETCLACRNKVET